MTTHHDDDDAWLDALAGRGSKGKNKETEVLRAKLLQRKIQLEQSCKKSQLELEGIRQRLDREGLLKDGIQKKWWQETRSWLFDHQTFTWAGALASLMLAVGLIGKMTEWNTHDWVMDRRSWSGNLKYGVDTIRGINKKGIPQSGYGINIVGYKQQIVGNIETSRAEWEADLLGSGADYRVDDSKISEGYILLYIDLEKGDHTLLSPGHRRVFEGMPEKGFLVVKISKL